MVIDLSLQRIDPGYKRLWNDTIKVFFKEYVCDKLTCPLMLITLASLVFVIICAGLP